MSMDETSPNDLAAMEARSMDEISPGDLAAMQARLKERAAEEAKSLKEAKAPAVTPDLVARCASFGEAGDGILHAALFAGRFVYMPETKSWYSWAGQHWEPTHIHKVEASVAEVGTKYREVAAHYRQEAKRAGAEGAVRWLDTFPRARRLPPVGGKDPGESYTNGENLRLWILAGLPAGLRFAMSAGHSALGGEKEKGAPNGAGEAVGAAGTGEASAPDSGQGGAVPGAALEALRTLSGQEPADYSARQPWAWLKAQPATPKTALGMLRRAGIAVEATNDDFVIHGHDSWPHKEFAYLFTWLKSHGDMVRMALHGVELDNK